MLNLSTYLLENKINVEMDKEQKCCHIEMKKMNTFLE